MKLRSIKMICTALLCLVATKSMAQCAEVKINLASAAIAVVNPSMELGFAERSAITIDYTGIFAKEDYMGTGYPFMLSMGTFGYRFYTKRNQHSGLFVAGEFALFGFRMNKNIVPLLADENRSHYDVGFGYLFGLNAGYKYKISKKFSVEASFSYGWHESMHEGYSEADGTRLFTLNPSVELIPYKAGIYLTYNLW